MLGLAACVYAARLTMPLSPRWDAAAYAAIAILVVVGGLVDWVAAEEVRERERARREAEPQRPAGRGQAQRSPWVDPRHLARRRRKRRRA